MLAVLVTGTTAKASAEAMGAAAIAAAMAPATTTVFIRFSFANMRGVYPLSRGQHIAQGIGPML